MISALSITDFILIDRLNLEAGSGLTGLTGQTGAGKSILLDALGLALGDRPDKGFVRAGANQATVAVGFSISPTHPVWALLDEQGGFSDRSDGLVLKRILPRVGAARGFINDQPVSTSLLRAVGEQLVEIHGQNTSSSWLNVSQHRDYLDQYADNADLLETCQAKWDILQAARKARQAWQEKTQKARDDAVWLRESLSDLERLKPEAGEASRLADERRALMETGRVAAALSEAQSALSSAPVEMVLGRVSGVLSRVSDLPALSGEVPMGRDLREGAEAFERVVIELEEATRKLSEMAVLVEGDGSRLEEVDNRLFALRGAGRRHGIDPDMLEAHVEEVRQLLMGIEGDDEQLQRKADDEADAAADWHAVCADLRAARTRAARLLEVAISEELRPLKLERMQIKILVEAVEGEQAGARGADHVEIIVAPNPGHGFGPLRKVASGGELSRVSLALRCALAGGGAAPTLIFDEADQGVGGSVAAAIGERLLRLSQDLQIFAITHSPQVAAACQVQWQIDKREDTKGLGRTQVSVLDEVARCEEIARMLSGVVVTSAARAAAAQLLEGP